MWEKEAERDTSLGEAGRRSAWATGPLSAMGRVVAANGVRVGLVTARVEALVTRPYAVLPVPGVWTLRAPVHQQKG